MGKFHVFVVDEKEDVGVLFDDAFTRWKFYQKASEFDWRACRAVGMSIVAIAMEDLGWYNALEYDAFLNKFRRSASGVAEELIKRVNKYVGQ